MKHKDIRSVAEARMEVRRRLGFPPSTRALEKHEMQRLYEQLRGEEMDYPTSKYDVGYISAEDLSLMIADELNIPRGDGTNYLRKAELLAALGRL